MASKIFSLEGKGLKLDTAEDVEPYIQSLRENDAVMEVRLAGNTLGTEACKALGAVLETKKTLKIANLADIFTSRLLAEIPPALSSLLTALLTLPYLHTINLSDNAFGLKTQAPLVAFLAEHAPLQHLILNNNGLGPEAGTLIANALTELRKKKEGARKDGKQVPDLETVVCGRNRLENGSMAAWARAFAAHSRIREVRMVQNGIRQEGISHLLHEGLRHAETLAVLDLQDNTFTAVASRTLADVVPSWPQLRVLGLGDCLLSARGGVLVAEALAKGGHAQLTTLRLQHNDIDARGLARLAQAAETSLPALQRVELNGNKFSDEDPGIATLRSLLTARQECSPSDVGTKDEDGDKEGEWGIDSLSDLEDPSDEEDEDEEEEEEDEERAEKVVKDAALAEEQEVAQDRDAEVDALAGRLAGAEIR
ncbi:MAG: hypothetical protein M1832_000887 [Thelocarpon impressellum]|nr:MAG: hypothetical protein M1832_000887 [Thelocarpon impressellum]